ncbi:ATP synthase subunit 5 [Sparassis latifolia]|uniref:ATP synthase subunit 5, mitochondrial n=1 Tax=Sparassis crispa TaxID=139825 RepID=A0A401GFM0_9APHY|nr:ATP synthase subunit 5, mitochondrial [Sparassis crispa]GBE80978.1 ATP synthase subunit 5, mitochondrial [Sparassis crispa]
MLLSSARSAVPARLGQRAASSLALKYSNAVFSAALSKSPQVINKVQSELNTISTSIKEVPEISTFVTNPTLSAKDRQSGLAALYARAESAGAKKEPVSDITKNLFVVLSENGRLGETQGVIEGFNELVATYKGELTVTITSAAPLPRDVQTRLESTLKQSQAAQKAKSVKVINKINPGVLGGIVVDFGDKTVDLSVASRVNKLNSLLQLSV